VAPEQESATADGDSPRITPRADSGVPPTWTPQPPPPTPAPLGTQVPAFRPAPGEGASEGEVYEVVAGDTLAEIAERFGVDVERLAAANGIDDVDQIEVGQLLVIPR
jgi:LysM repeat protein